MRDSEVVAAIVAGDPNGLAEAYDRYAAPLYTYCRSLLREPADAADAVQDTFVIAASKLAGLRDQSRLRPWLYAVARNECHRRLREKASAATSALDLVPEMSDESADVTGGAERAELRALLRSAVRGLNAGEQDLIELQLRQELDVAEIAAVLGVTRNHAHALLSRARDQLEISLGALLVARSGREDCAALSALLQDWDGQLTVLMRKRINRHIEQCPACTERKRRELAPALLLGLAPLAAAMPSGLREQVLRLVSSDTPEAVAHRAGVAQRAPAFGQHGFPKPLDPPKSPWWRTRQGQGAAAAVVVAALALAILALTGVLGGNHGRLSALSRGSAGTGTSGSQGVPGGPSGSTASGTLPASPGSPTGTAGPGSAARVSPSPAPGATSPGGGAPSPSTAPPSHGPSPSHSPSPSHHPSPSSPAPSSSATTTTPPPGSGTLSVTPTTIVLSAPGRARLTVTATLGPVSWSVTESSGLLGKVTVAPTSGTLLAGRSATVTVTASGGLAGLAALGSPGGGGLCVACTLTVNPGGHVVTIVIEISVGQSSSPPGSGGPDEAVAARRPG